MDEEMKLFSGHYSFISNDSWDFTRSSSIDEVITAMYFALTSLSTCGFGDMYPKTDVERVGCSLMLLSGVSVFSYVLGELRYMMSNMKNLESAIEEKEKLEMFFLLLEKFNYGWHLDHDL
jgi:hypothetical protein